MYSRSKVKLNFPFTRDDGRTEVIVEDLLPDTVYLVTVATLGNGSHSGTPAVADIEVRTLEAGACQSLHVMM